MPRADFGVGGRLPPGDIARRTRTGFFGLSGKHYRRSNRGKQDNRDQELIFLLMYNAPEGVGLAFTSTHQS